MSEGYHPILPGLILGLPLLGAALNGIGAFAWRENKMVPTVVDPEVIWACTTCRGCEDACPLFITYVEKIVDARRNLVLNQFIVL